MFLKKYIIYFILALLFLGCGSDNNHKTSLNYYPIIDNEIRQYVGGEKLTYNFFLKQFNENDQSEGAITGTETIEIYLKYQPPLIVQFTKFSSEQIPEIHNFYYYDEKGNFTHYIPGKNNIDEIIIPNNLNIGDEWYYDDLKYDEDYVGLKEYIVNGVELITVPFGQVETFRIAFSGFYIKENDEDAITINGTMWVHPKIGIIKTQEVMSFIPSGEHQTFGNQLVEINWDI